MAIVLVLLSSVTPFTATSACNHERYCTSTQCIYCDSLYTGNNIRHDYMNRYWHCTDTYHWELCLDCGSTLQEGEHYTLCCEYLQGNPKCFDCSASYSPINIVHHMLYEDDGTPVDCCSFFPDNSTLPGNSSSGNNGNAPKNYQTDYLYKNSAPLFDVVEFGVFEQDNNLTNGKEPIQWYILYSDREKALLLSRFALLNKNFNKSFANVDWESSTIRSWLNNNFYGTAFTYEEQTSILTNQKGYTYSSARYGEIATADEVFLLSLEEVNYYFDTVLSRQLIATPYAKANGIQVTDNYSWWWLRTMGDSNKIAQFVFENGTISTIGRDVSSYAGGVRPAIWVDVSVIR